jgi:hypothetical protein
MGNIEQTLRDRAAKCGTEPDGTMDVNGQIDLDAADTIATLTRERDEARAACAAMQELLRECWHDMFSTARVNQGSINGIELNTPDDPPCQAWIGKQRMTQRGVDETLALIERVQRSISADNPGQPIIDRLRELEAVVATAKERDEDGWPARDTLNAMFRDADEAAKKQP